MQSHVASESKKEEGKSWEKGKGLKKMKKEEKEKQKKDEIEGKGNWKGKQAIVSNPLVIQSLSLLSEP